MAILSEEEKMMEITTTEGVTLVADEMVEGAAIQVMDAEGGLVPAPAGEYESEDGMKIVVEEEGVIGAIVKKKPVEGGEDDEEKALQAKIEQAVQDAVAPLQSEITDLTGQLEQMTQENTALLQSKEKAEAKLSKIRGLGVQFSKGNEPIEEGVTKEKYQEALAKFNAERANMTPARRIAMNLSLQKMKSEIAE